MKKINNYLRIFIVLIVASFGFTSCDALIDDFQTDFGKGPVLATFENTVAELNIIKDAANTPIDYEIPITYFGGKNVALENDVTVTIATSSTSTAQEGVEFSLPVTTFTIPAGETTAFASIRILTGGLVAFDFLDLVLEITDSSESVSDVNTFTLTLKALDQNTLAGTYETVEGEYWNSGTYRGDFEGNTYVISAISPGLYKHAGIAFWVAGNNFYFTVDENTGVITILDEDLDGEPTLLNGSPIMTCAKSTFEMVPCDDTVNLRTLMPDGHHEVRLTTGYDRGTGSTREFYMRYIRL